MHEATRPDKWRLITATLFAYKRIDVFNPRPIHMVWDFSALYVTAYPPAGCDREHFSLSIQSRRDSISKQHLNLREGRLNANFPREKWVQFSQSYLRTVWNDNW